MNVPHSWREALSRAVDSPSFARLASFVEAERAEHEVFPPREDVFAALERTPPTHVRAVLLGQDPYHDVGQAHGLCFSVRRGTALPPSLRNVFKELKSDLGCDAPGHGDLGAWAERGVLLLNSVLTVRAHAAGSHRGRGWEQFTDAVLEHVCTAPHVVFLLWGKDARDKAKRIDTRRHGIVECAHPSPLSARKFLGSRPFSRANAALREQGQAEIDWSLPS